MKLAAGVDVYATGRGMTLMARRRHQDGLWMLNESPSVATVSGSDPSDLGNAVQALLSASKAAELGSGDRRRSADAARNERMAAVDIHPWGEFVESVRWVFVGWDGANTFSVERSNAFGGPDPGYRFYNAFVTLSSPDAPELGSGVLQSVLQCTWTQNPDPPSE